MRYVFHCEKLVRDRIPDLIAEPGSEVEVLTLNRKDHITALKDKLQEEVAELLRATSREEIIDEIADVKEVLDALILKLAISQTEVDEAKRNKCFKNGGFDRGLFLKTVVAPENSVIAERFLKDPLKYPKTFRSDS